MRRPVYIEVTKDRFELPLAVADSPYELASLRHVHVTGILRAIRHGGKTSSKYKVVWIR